MDTQDTSSSLCSVRRDEYLFGQTKPGGLGQVTTKENKEHEKKTGITRPRPDGGVATYQSKTLRQKTFHSFLSLQKIFANQCSCQDVCIKRTDCSNPANPVVANINKNRSFTVSFRFVTSLQARKNKVSSIYCRTLLKLFMALSHSKLDVKNSCHKYKYTLGNNTHQFSKKLITFIILQLALLRPNNSNFSKFFEHEAQYRQLKEKYSFGRIFFDNFKYFESSSLGSITSRCSGNEPALLPQIEPTSSFARLIIAIGIIISVPIIIIIVIITFLLKNDHLSFL